MGAIRPSLTGNPNSVGERFHRGVLMSSTRSVLGETMTRLASTLLLMVCCGAPLAAQSQIGSGQIAEGAGTLIVPAPPPAPADTALTGEPLLERTVGGAVVGAVTGAALSAEDSNCAPSGSAAGAIAFGAVWGAIRGALKLNLSNDLASPNAGDNGGEEGPFPFDGDKREGAKS